MSDVRVTRISVMPKGDAIYSEACTHVSIEDEVAGEFVSIEQDGDTTKRIAIDVEEWPSIQMAVDQIIEEIQRRSNGGRGDNRGVGGEVNPCS